MVILLMGLSGCGLTTVGPALAKAIKGKFVDADALHPPAVKAKLRKGVPLDDGERVAWLISTRDKIRDWDSRERHCVLACKALRTSYRAILSQQARHTCWVYLKGDPSALRDNLEKEGVHARALTLLDHELAELEEPVAEEKVLTLTVNDTLETQIARIMEMLENSMAS